MGKSIAVACCVILLLAFRGNAQLSVDAPFFKGKKLTVLAYKGLRTDTVFSSFLDKSGKALVAVSQDGFILLRFDEKQFFPMLYSATENRFRIATNGLPDFSGCPQNSFFMRQLVKRQELKGKLRILDESIKKNKSDAQLVNALKNKKNDIGMHLSSMRRLCTDSSSYTGSVLIAAMDLMDQSSGISSEDSLIQVKKELRNFIRDHYQAVSTSNLLQQFANQYMMMNEYVVVGKQNIESHVEKDIRDWIDLLKGRISNTEVVHYFLEYFRSRLMITMSGSIIEAFPEESSCPALQSSAGVAALPTGNQEALYIIIDVDCPAAVTGLVMVQRCINEKGIILGAIPVFCGRIPDNNDERVFPDLSNAQFLTRGISQIGDTIFRPLKYPAFVMVDAAGKIIFTEYTMKGIKEQLGKWTKKL